MKKKYTETPRAMINVTENHSYVVPTRMVQEPTGWQRIRNVQDHKKKFSAWFLTIFRQPSATDVPLYVPAKKSFLQLCQLLCNEDMNCIQWLTWKESYFLRPLNQSSGNCKGLHTKAFSKTSPKPASFQTEQQVHPLIQVCYSGAVPNKRLLIFCQEARADELLHYIKWSGQVKS